MPARSFALFRTGLGLIVFIWLATLLRDLDAFFGRDSLALEPSNATSLFNVFSLFHTDSAITIGIVVGLLACIGLIAGRFTRVGGVLLAIIFPSVMAENQMLWNAGDDLLQTFCLLFGFYCLLTPSSDLNVSLRMSLIGGAVLASGRIWFLQMVRIQMTVVYLVAFLTKTPGPSWRDGTATMTVLRIESLERFPTPELLTTNLYIGNAMTWASLALEGLLPLLLWNRRSRSMAVVCAVFFHLFIDWSLAIGLFSWVMILGLSTFLDRRTPTSSTRPAQPGPARPTRPGPAATSTDELVPSLG